MQCIYVAYSLFFSVDPSASCSEGVISLEWFKQHWSTPYRISKILNGKGSFETIFWVLFQIYEMQYAQIPRRLLDLEAPDGSSKGVSSVAVGPEL